MCKILQERLCFPTMHAYNQDYCCSCDVFQRTENPSRRDEMPLVPKLTLQAFDKWVVDFVGPISLVRKCTGARYIITVMDNLNKWEKVAPIKDCIVATTTKFLFENVVTRFGCPKILISNQGTHFFNQLIEELTAKFQIQHRITTPYHPQENGAVEAFNNILENALTKVCNTRRDDWDQKISAVLWAYHRTCKKLAGQTPFMLLYG